MQLMQNLPVGEPIANKHLIHVDEAQVHPDSKFLTADICASHLLQALQEVNPYCPTSATGIIDPGVMSPGSQVTLA